jgi:hypothetical protein
MMGILVPVVLAIMIIAKIRAVFHCEKGYKVFPLLSQYWKRKVRFLGSKSCVKSET